MHLTTQVRQTDALEKWNAYALIYPSRRHKGRCQKKTGLCGENSQTGGGGGLTQTHFLMSIYQVIFGMPKWLPTNLACHLSWRKTGICGKLSQQRGGVTYSQRNCFLWGQNCDFLVKTKNVPEFLKWKINPTFFLITGFSQSGGGGVRHLGIFPT